MVSQAIANKLNPLVIPDIAVGYTQKGSMNLE